MRPPTLPKNRVRVFDFDDTCTTPAEGSDEIFISSHRADLARMLDRSPEWMEAAYREAREIIVNDPNAFGWEIDGVIVAPALVGAFVEARVCAQIVLQSLGKDVSTWSARLDELYQIHYPKYVSTFRPEVLEVFRTLRKQHKPFYIVSNSDPDKVRARLNALGEDSEWLGQRVIGFAKKYVVTTGPVHVQQQIFLPGLQRPIALRRKHYLDILEEILRMHQREWEGLEVIGDIVELDLLLPVTMCARGSLITGPNTPDYERAWANTHPRTRTITSLLEVLD